jgi:hypothetical protein
LRLGVFSQVIACPECDEAVKAEKNRRRASDGFVRPLPLSFDAEMRAGLGEGYPSGVDRLVLIVDYLDAAQLRPALRARLAAEHGTDDIDGGRRATPSLERGGTGADFGGG